MSVRHFLINVPSDDVSMPNENENENVYVAPPERLPSPSSPSRSQSQSQSHHNDALNPCQSASPSPSRAPSTRNMSEAEAAAAAAAETSTPVSSLFGGSTCACLANIVWAVLQPHLTRSQNVANVFAALHLFFGFFFLLLSAWQLWAIKLRANVENIAMQNWSQIRVRQSHMSVP